MAMKHVPSTGTPEQGKRGTGRTVYTGERNRSAVTHRRRKKAESANKKMQHDGLERAAAELTANEELLAYLDDLYVITSSAISAQTKPVAEFGEAYAAASLLRSQGWQECPEKPGLATGLTAGSSTHRVATHLVNQRFRAPAWDAALANAALPPHKAVEDGDGDGVDDLRGWQRRASRACDERALETHFADLSPASRAVLQPKPRPSGGPQSRL
ncbi:hypothetical protein AK812_SmicGene22653 [Symbiodinium microadriaticum]|uniref:Uncharacterized protein n=1 Tax=Symbiodinium microadriaticum TaxID=2951 RepID=A0A1Q9DJA1_SYMMI|nr:hypothetical protein AK812_SmicGene22653 [Symbiodinium microadriaticum]